jgi:hypothetical protein
MGIHVDMPTTAPPEVAKAPSCGAPAPSDLSAEEKAVYEQLGALYKTGTGFVGVPSSSTDARPSRRPPRARYPQIGVSDQRPNSPTAQRLRSGLHAKFR